MESLRIVDRDRVIVKEVDRWRACLGRHIKELAGFSGQRACDRRLRKLIDTGYITRKKILYGLPAIYQLTAKAKHIADVTATGTCRTDQLNHDIIVLDTAIHLNKSGVPFSNITTEKQLHKQDGFGKRKRRPDFVFTHDCKTACVEVELTLKEKGRFEKNMKDNFMAYDRQIWVVPNLKCKIYRILKANIPKYPNIEILEVSEVVKHAK